VRPSVDVIVPFHGSRGDLDDLLRRLDLLQLGVADTITVVDNTPLGIRLQARPGSSIDVVRAPEQQSAYYARNRGADHGSAEWLLFIDADVDPSPGLIERHMTPVPGERTAILAGAVHDGAPRAADRETVAGRYARLRRLMDQENTLRQATPYAKTANCAVRRIAFQAVGGFHERIRSGGDAELCFRLYEAGWQLEPRPEAVVGHRPRRRLIDLLGQRARHGSGSEWLEQRYPGFAGPRRGLPGIGKDIVLGGLTAVGPLVLGDSDRALLRLLDPLSNAAFEAGRRVPNLPWPEHGGIVRLARYLDHRLVGARRDAPALTRR
jgi:glycosyltransferase involved in cell wall biosynthesis